MRRRQRTRNIKDFAKDELVKHSKWLLYNRWQLLAPCPFEPADVYQATLTEAQHMAVEELDRTMPTCLERNTEFNLIFDMPAHTKTYTGQIHVARFLTVTLPDPRPLPNTEIYRGNPPQKFYLSSLPSSMRFGIKEWAVQWLKAQAETAEVVAKLDSLFTVCNTLGQAKRVWPQITALLTQRAQDKLAEAKVKSPYPEEVLERSSDWDDRIGNYKVIGLKDEWKPEALQWYDERLTEALCLPMEYTLEDSHFERFKLKVDWKLG